MKKTNRCMQDVVPVLSSSSCAGVIPKQLCWSYSEAAEPEFVQIADFKILTAFICVFCFASGIRGVDLKYFYPLLFVVLLCH